MSPVNHLPPTSIFTAIPWFPTASCRRGTFARRARPTGRPGPDRPRRHRRAARSRRRRRRMRHGLHQRGEISIEWQGTPIHIVGLGSIPRPRPGFRAGGLRQGRVERARRMAEALRPSASRRLRRGRALCRQPGLISRPLRPLPRRSRRRQDVQASSSTTDAGQPVTSITAGPPSRTPSAGSAPPGVAVVAHPGPLQGLRRGELRRFLDEFKDTGGQGLGGLRQPCPTMSCISPAWRGTAAFMPRGVGFPRAGRELRRSRPPARPAGRLEADLAPGGLMPVTQYLVIHPDTPQPRLLARAAEIVRAAASSSSPPIPATPWVATWATRRRWTASARFARWTGATI